MVPARLFSALVACALAAPAASAESLIRNAAAATKPAAVSFQPSGAGGGTADTGVLVFTSPPREKPAEGQSIFGPVAEYLTSAIGKKVVYRHPGTWGAYRSEMLRGDYDIIFDGPHFIGYRTQKLYHNALVKIPGRLDFAVVTRKDEKYESLAQMGGRTFCTHAPPHLGTLTLLSQFNNPARQPAIIPIEGWDNIYRGVTAGRCVGAVFPLATLKKLDKNGELRIVYQSQSLPNQGFSAGPRIALEDQARIAAALLAPEASVPLEKLRAAFRISDRLLTTNNSEYAGLGELLRGEFGYY